MRAPRRRRPRKRRIEAVPQLLDLEDLARRAGYVGSPEHKDVPSYAGQPHLRADASCCPRDIARDQRLAEDWLRTAIARGAVGAPWEGAFPRYVWYQHGGVVFEGRLVNRELGKYKGYPLEADEWPLGIDNVYPS